MDLKVDHTTAVIFDLDDTLYNEIEYLKSAFAQIARELEKDSWKALYARMFSLYRSRQDVFQYLSDIYVTDKNYLLQLYRGHQPEIRLYEGALELLIAIKSKKGMTGIITDGRSTTQKNKINALGIDTYLDHVVISEELGSTKPAFRNFEVMAEILKAETYYYIGDNLSKDFIAPNNLGWSTIGLIDNGQNIHNEAYKYMNEKYMPHEFINDLREIYITD